MSKFITQQGLQKLKEELEYLKTTKQKEISERLRRAIAHGDLSENFDYADAKEQQAMLLAKIAELEGQIREAKVVSETTKLGRVQIGSTVQVESSGTKLTFKIVAANEANPLEGKISDESPIGSALLGKKEGQKAKGETPDGPTEYKILKIA